MDKVEDYYPGFDPTKYTPDPKNANVPTADMIQVGRYYYDDKLASLYPAETKKPEAQVSSYLIKGGDLELEVVNDDSTRTGYTKPEFWSLRKALAWKKYNDSPIKMICEVPVLEGLVIDGSEYSGAGGRKVIFDVNSFDIQIANHQTTGAAALTVKNATLTLKDGFNTTGAELAVGNNARMSIQEGGTLIIDETCQLEVEYDAASTAPSGTDPAPDPKQLDSGIISIENGGKIINHGVLTIEGTEGKPIDPAAPAIRDKKDAVLTIKEGGTLDNYGCVLSYGELYCMGTIINRGQYDDVITSKDPDKGNFTYHRGIQVSWKDDVTQDSVYMGHLYVGEDNEGNHNPDAIIENNGDIVMVPGIFECYGKLINNAGGNVYVCPVEEAVIPIQPPVDRPLDRETRIKFGAPLISYLDINQGGTLDNAGKIRAANVEIVNNGRTGKLEPMEPSDRLFDGLVLNSLGTATNSGTIVLDNVSTFGEMTNTGNIETKVIVSSNTTQEGILYDKAAKKLTEVYNASLRVDGNTNIWSHAACTELTVTPQSQNCKGGTTPSWTVTAKTNASGEGILYWVEIFSDESSNPLQTLKIEAGKETQVTGPVLPDVNSNKVYRFTTVDGTNGVHAEANVTVTSDKETPPAAIGDLIYNGKQQALITTGGTADGKALQYRLGENGAWTDAVPTAKDAGTYKIYYRLTGAAEAEGSVEVTISKRPVTVSGVDISSKKGEALKEPEYTVSGIVDGEKLEGVSASLGSEADNSKPGTYPITVTVKGENPNYEITVYPGTYTITNGDLSVIAKDKYGVFSDELTYKGFLIDLKVTPSDVKPYYNVDGTELTDENYKTAGSEEAMLKDLPAGAGTHIVYYYVTDGTDVIRGSKRVIIEKAQQKAPENILTRAETYKNAGDGSIEGLKPRVMEYRQAGNDGTYKTAYNVKEYVRPGVYLVRMMGDRNHYPSPDCMVTVGEGTGITVSFYLTEEDTEPYETAEGLAVGDLVTRPVDPVREGYTFLGWYLDGEAYDFSKAVTTNFNLYGQWKETPVHVHSLKLVEAKEPTCTERGNKIYYVCSECGLWFEDATALVEIKDRPSVILPALGHKWGPWKQTKAPTAEEEGEETRTCERCGEKETRVVPKTDPEPAPEPTPEPETFTVRFNANGHGTAPAAQTVESGKKASEPAALSAAGYTFGGWYKEASCRTKFSFSTLITADITLYAKWTKNSVPDRSSSDDDSESEATRANGSWAHDAAGWRYMENGSPVKASWRFLYFRGLSYWYYFDGTGIMQTGWFDWNNSRYYLYPVSDGWMGRMLTGWHQIDGKWYYFETVAGKNQGHMYRSERTPDGFYVGADGIWDGNPANAGR